MTVGLSAANLATAWLNTIRGAGNGVTFTAPATLFAELHVGDPGAAGTANPSAVTTRSALGFAASSGGSALALTGTNPSWSMTTTETISHIAVWSASTAGTFYFSAALSVSKAVNNGDTLTLTTLGFSLTPQAA
jgi:hypothetical protein